MQSSDVHGLNNKDSFDYDMATILQNSSQGSEGEPFEIPDYIHGSLTVRKLDGRGRGVITTQEILPGQLLIAVKPIAIVFDADLDQEARTASSSLKKQVQKLAILREKVVTAVETSDEICANLYNLHAGPQLGYLEGHQTRSVDLERIERICALNGFQGTEELGCSAVVGLWYFPSFLNHICQGSNAHWTIFKDTMFVRAARKIQRQEEILISYVDPNRPYSERRALFLKHDFFCHCQLCALERDEGKELRLLRDNLLSDFQSLPQDGGSAAARQIVDALDSLRPLHPHLNVFMVGPLLEAGLCAFEKGAWEDALEDFIKCFELCQVSAQLNLMGISCALTIATCYLRTRDVMHRALVPFWIKEARKCAQIQYGTSTGIFEIIRPTFVKEMTKEGFDL